MYDNTAKSNIGSYQAENSYPTPVAASPALHLLLSKLEGSVNPSLDLINQIEKQLHGILDMRTPEKEGGVNANEFQGDGIVTQLNVQIERVKAIQFRLERIEKHLRAIIG